MKGAPCFAHASDLELVHLLGCWIENGEVPPSWVHRVNIYEASPFELTARHPRVTAANGDDAWFFLCDLEPKDKERDARIKRTAGEGTWKGERRQPLATATANGEHEQVGWHRSLSYVKKGDQKKGQKVTFIRLGWILKEFMLLDETIQTAIYKLYASKRTGEMVTPLSTAPSASATSGLGTSAATAAAGTGTSAATAAAGTGTTHGAPPRAAENPVAAAATSIPLLTNGSGETSPDGTEATAATSASGTGTAAAEANHKTSLSSPTSPPATPSGDSSPEKTWVKVQISNSPMKNTGQSTAKRVYQMMLPLEEGAAARSTDKRRRTMQCEGFLVIKPLKESSPVA